MKKLIIGIVLIGSLAFVGWQNRVSLLMSGIPILFNIMDPIAEEGMVNWPEGPNKASSDPEKSLVTTLEMEKEINTFFRLTSFSVIKRLKETFPNMSEKPSQKEVFIKLRELRNRW